MSKDNSERRGLTHSFRSQSAYGTANTLANQKTAPRTRKFISRKLSRTDTLQGIALRYGVLIQDLKKENKLWTNDSLFLRENLLIPLTSDNETCLDPENDTVVVYNGSTLVKQQSENSAFNGASTRPKGSQVNCNKPKESENEKLPTVSSSHNSSHKILSSGPNSRVTSETAKEVSSGPSCETTSGFGIKREEAADSGISSEARSSKSSSVSSASSLSSSNAKPSDFFAKFDQNIAQLKANVEQLDANATRLEGIVESNPLVLPPRKGSNSNASGRKSRVSSLDEGVTNSPVLLIRSRTNSKQVKSTLERSQQASDDLFEL